MKNLTTTVIFCYTRTMTNTQDPKQVLAIIDRRIDLQLTPAILNQLALKGITAEAARKHLRNCAMQALKAQGEII